MKTEPTPITSSMAGTPLSSHASRTSRRAVRPKLKAAESDAISDTLETTDKDPEGPPTRSNQAADHSSNSPSDGSTGSLDLLG